MEIGKFKIVAFDEFNLAVYEEREITKGDNAGKMKDYHHGYYGDLSGALRKVCSESLKDSLEHSTASELLEAVRSLYDSVNEKYKHIKPRQFNKGEEV